jgi:hypothetical protein
MFAAAFANEASVLSLAHGHLPSNRRYSLVGLDPRIRRIGLVFSALALSRGGIRTVTTLKRKRQEITTAIANYAKRLAQARPISPTSMP